MSEPTGTVAIDTNILVYAELEPDSDKGQRAVTLLETLPGMGLLTLQVVGEFLNVMRRRRPDRLQAALTQVEIYTALFTVVRTDLQILLHAARFAERYQLQYWDSVIWQASRRGGATILLSEDLQDGFAAGGMRVVDPFAAEPSPALRALLAR